MKFYLCQTPVGPQYAYTLVDATKLDPNFTKVDIDLAQKPLMALLNDLMRRAHAAEQSTGEGSVDPVSSDDGEVMIRSYVEEKKANSKTLTATDERLSRVWDQVGIEQFVHDTPDNELFRLNRIEDAIASRRREVEG